MPSGGVIGGTLIVGLQLLARQAGDVTVAVLTNVPVELAAILPTNVTVMVPPLAATIDAPTWPVAGVVTPQTDPLLAAQVILSQLPICDGAASSTITPLAGALPALVITTVYVTAPPATLS